MSFCSVPYEADYGMYAESKMNPGQGQGMQPLNPPQMNLQMASGMPSYPMQSMPLNMMPGGGNGGMTPMSTMATQLPIGAMAPLSSMTMMPMMGNSIDAPGINAVLPDLQSMSQMQPMGHQMQSLNQMQPMQQYGQSGSNTQMSSGRLAGGSNASPLSPSQAGGWNANPGQMMANGGSNGGSGMWQYSQPMQQHQPQMQYHQAPQYNQQLYQPQHQNQAQQQQQQGQRMKSYDLVPSGIHYRDVRNGLNSPSTQESSKCIKTNNSFNYGKMPSKVPHWR